MHRLAWTIVLGIGLGMFHAAADSHAALMLNVERQSDKVAIVKGAGMLDNVPNVHDISLNGALAGLGGVDEDQFSGNFAIGGLAPAYVFGRYALPNFVLQYIPVVPANGAASGQMTVTLNTETWAAVGTSGGIFLGNNGDRAQIGTFMVTPLPAALPLLASGLAVLGLVRAHRRRSNAATASRSSAPPDRTPHGAGPQPD